MSVYYVLNIFSIASGLFPVIAALYNYQHLDKVLRIVAVFLLLSFISDISQTVTMVMGAKNNLPIIHFYILVSVIFYAVIYYYAFFKPIFKKAVLVISGIVLLVIIYNLIFIQNIWQYPSVSNTLVGIMLISFSLVYFYQLLTRQEFIHIEKQGLFWINAGILFYFSITIFLFMLFNRMIQIHQVEYYMINDVTNIIANILFSIGLLCKPQKTT